MTEDFATARGEELRSLVESLVRFDTTGGNERPAQDWLAGYLDDAGFDTYEWTADADELAGHPSFPDDPGEIDVADRPSIAGVVEFGDPEAGRTLVLNGHVDVVPIEDEVWSSDPFDPVWRDGTVDRQGDGDGSDGEGGETLTARGAADMKAGLAACVVAAESLRDAVADPEEDPEGEATLNGRLVVESVAGEEEGGIGAAAAALSNPYPFERDAALVAEPTDLRAVVATEGTVMKRLRVEGRSAHAATRWRGESVLPHFRAIHDAFQALESERAERVTHPLYDRFEVPWPITAGVVRAGTWASTVPAELTAEFRIGVAPGETVDEVEAEFEERLDSVVADSEWLSAHPPDFERFSIQFEPAEIDPDEPVVRALRAALRDRGLDDDPVGVTYGADSRHYVAAGVPTAVFGPGTIEEAHSPDETIEWRQVTAASEAIADAARRFLAA